MNLDDVQRVRIADLVIDPSNARKHGPKNLEAIKASLTKFGQRLPIVVRRDGMIVEAGNGRVEAARALGWKEIVALVVDDDATTAAAFAIADNRSGELAEWDDEVLAKTLQALSEDGWDLDGIGFDDEDLAELLAGPTGRSSSASADDDQGPVEPPRVPFTQRGDVWILGRHRLMCGDSTSAEDVAALLAGAEPEIMVTDPPYGVQYNPEWRRRAGVNKTKRTGKVANDDRADWSDAWGLFTGDIAYVFHAAIHCRGVADSLESHGMEIRSQIIWAKEHMTFGRGDYHWQHEPCWYAVRKGKSGRRTDDRSQTTLWMISSKADDEVVGNHATPKPVECMARPIRNHLVSTVYEPFSGSGTTIIASETEGATCYAMEIEPGYVDAAVQRWINLTGEVAIRESDGAQFPGYDRSPEKA